MTKSLLLNTFSFRKKKTCAKRKIQKGFLVKVFTAGKKVVGKAFFFKERFVLNFLFRSFGFV